MDIQTPEMNGIDATREIRRREAETGRSWTPILAVTANALDHQVAEYEAASMDGVVAKPVDMAGLYRRMEQVMSETSSQLAQEQSASH